MPFCLGPSTSRGGTPNFPMVPADIHVSPNRRGLLHMTATMYCRQAISRRILYVLCCLQGHCLDAEDASSSSLHQLTTPRVITGEPLQNIPSVPRDVRTLATSVYSDPFVWSCMVRPCCCLLLPPSGKALSPSTTTEVGPTDGVRKETVVPVH